jgi:hypothetical protein
MKQFFQTTLLFCLFLSFSSSLLAQQAPINFFRPYDQSGLHVFEPGKADTVPYEGLRVRVGGNFAQQFQALSHENQALPNIVDNVNLNQLFGLAPGFNLATANLNIDVQLEDGIRLNLITYLSSRHHPEAWVKGGFIQFDKLKFFNSEVVDRVMEKLTIRMGHMEVNYGDAHFRRTDNGNAMYNPFVGNYILDEPKRSSRLERMHEGAVDRKVPPTRSRRVTKRRSAPTHREGSTTEPGPRRRGRPR